MCAVVGLSLTAATLPGAEPLSVEYRWLREPDLNIAWMSVEPQPILRVAPESIQSPSAKERFEAARAILRLSDQPSPARAPLLEALIGRLEQGEPQSAVGTACLAAACELDDGTNAERLWKIAGEDVAMRPIVEQACIRWRSSLPCPLWRSFLVDEKSTELELGRALEGIGAAGGQEDLPLLIKIVSDADRPPPLRLLAARAIGQLSRQEQLTLAEQLSSSSAENRQLLALAVLGHQPTPATTQFVLQLAERGTPLAQRHAYQWLCEVQPDLAREKAAAFASHPDPWVRRASLEQLARFDESDDQVKDVHLQLRLLGDGLGDIHSGVRNRARELLLATWSRSDEHQPAAESVVFEQLASDNWQSLEQSLRLAVAMQSTGQVPRMIELLEHPRPEVGITAAWALRHLATETSALEAMLTHAKRMTAQLSTPELGTATVEEHDLRRVAHLLEAFGIRRYEPAQQLLLQYVPKNDHRMGMITRIAGVWACGKMWAGKENRRLAAQLCERITDKSIIVPELDTVRYTALLALGFLGDPETRDVAAIYMGQGSQPVARAAAWAVDRIDQR